MTRAKKPAEGATRRQLSPAELAQRRAAAQKSTGPRTEQGKAICSRNGWKHGLTSAVHQSQFDAGLSSLLGAMGKPCKTTCPIHPDNPNIATAPCSMVVDGMTKAGGNCLDKRVYVEAFGTIIAAVERGEMGGMHGLMANEIAAQLQMLNDLRASVSDVGMVVPVPAFAADGTIVCRADGSEVIGKLLPNPGYPLMLKTLEVLGINLPELLATPAARSRAKTEEESASAMQTLLGGIMQRTQRPPGITNRPPIEHRPKTDD